LPNGRKEENLESEEITKMTELLTKEELLDLAKRKFDLKTQVHEIAKGLVEVKQLSGEWDAISEKLNPLYREIEYINNVLAIHCIKQED